MLVTSTPFSIISYFYIFIYFIFSISYSWSAEGEIKSIMGFVKFSYYIKNIFQNWNVPKTCQCCTGNFLSSSFSPYPWRLERIYILGQWGEFRVKNANLNVRLLFRRFFNFCFVFLTFSFFEDTLIQIALNTSGTKNNTLKISRSWSWEF